MSSKVKDKVKVAAPKRPLGEPKATNGTSIPVFVRLDKVLVEEIDRMVQTARVHPTLKHMTISRSTLIRAAVETGLVVWCRTQGLLPTQAEPE